MSAFFLILLRILFPLRPVLQLWEATRYYIHSVLAWAHDLEDLVRDPTLCAELESCIVRAEDTVHLLIQARAREILGLPLDVFRAANPVFVRRRARSAHDVMRRFERVVALFQNAERLAQNRAARLRVEREVNPLGLCADIAVMMFVAPRLTHDGMSRRSAANAGGGLAFSYARAPPAFA